MAVPTCRALVLLLAATLSLSQAALLVRPAAAGARVATTDPTSPPDVAAVAKANETSVAEVARILADPTARLDETQRIYFIDPAPAPPAGSERLEAGPVPYSETFLLHSRPGSRRTIYLDFDGETISNSAWNGDFGAPSGPFFAEPFSLDASAAFSTAEQDIVQSVWQRVAEDYAPFDIDVTTQDPGPAAITRSGYEDLVFGTRALITHAPEVGDTCGCGGVAYIGVFDATSNHAFYQPAWVAAQNLGDNVKYIAEATSHEVGHNLGLSHDGTSSQGYYDGHGSWAPIMGVGYYEPTVQFSRGEYPDASNHESDFDVVGAHGGTLAVDDHGDSPAAASGLGSGPSVSAAGLISTDTDVDVFRVEASAGSAAFSAVPAPGSPNLDILLELRDGAGNVVGSADPPSARVHYDAASGMSASLSTAIPAAGTYYLHVSGTGFGTLANGYSGYGSLGTYRLTGTLVEGGSTISVDDAPAVSEGPTGVNSTAGFTVALSSPAAGPVTVVATAANGTATAGSDFTAGPTTLTFAAGVTAMPFPVTVVGDSTVEPTETFLVNLSSPSGAALGDAQGIGTIVNDDYTVSVSDAQVTEGPSGVNATAGFIATLSSGAPSTVTVVASTADGTATAGSDYTAASATITFAAGVTSMPFPVTTIGDASVEPTETFLVNLTSPSGLSLADAQGVGTILNDEFVVSIGDAPAVAEGEYIGGTATFTLTLFPASPSVVTVVATAADGTATAGSDYVAVSSTITFAPGATGQTFPVAVVGDAVEEPTETFLVNLTSPSGAALGDGQGSGTITNDDTATLRSWGFNDYGQVGDGSPTSKATPTVLSLPQVASVAAGGFHSLALRGGTVWSWGLGHVGQLGRGTTSGSSVPAQVGGGLSGVTAVSAGVFHSLALRSDGTVWSWGWNAYGQLGDGTITDRSVPVPVVGLSGVVAIAAGGLHNLALKADGTVWAWGYNGVGQLGTPSPTQSPTAAPVPGLTGATVVAAGAYHSLAVRAGGALATWGFNAWGQLGDGTTTSRSVPVNVPGLSGVRSVAGGTGHSLALDGNAAVWSWGLGASGQLGRPVTGQSASPGIVLGPTGATRVVAGGYHSLALTPMGTVAAWGWNIFGQLGDGTTVDRTTAVPINLVRVLSISAGVAHNLTVAS